MPRRDVIRVGTRLSRPRRIAIIPVVCTSHRLWLLIKCPGTYSALDTPHRRLWLWYTSVNSMAWLLSTSPSYPTAQSVCALTQAASMHAAAHRSSCLRHPARGPISAAPRLIEPRECPPQETAHFLAPLEVTTCEERPMLAFVPNQNRQPPITPPITPSNTSTSVHPSSHDK